MGGTNFTLLRARTIVNLAFLAFFIVITFPICISAQAFQIPKNNTGVGFGPVTPRVSPSEGRSRSELIAIANRFCISDNLIVDGTRLYTKRADWFHCMTREQYCGWSGSSWDQFETPLERIWNCDQINPEALLAAERPNWVPMLTKCRVNSNSGNCTVYTEPLSPEAVAGFGFDIESVPLPQRSETPQVGSGSGHGSGSGSGSIPTVEAPPSWSCLIGDPINGLTNTCNRTIRATYNLIVHNEFKERKFITLGPGGFGKVSINLLLPYQQVLHRALIEWVN